jgi:hypothetical protein
MAKMDKLNAQVTVTSRRSTIVGCMSWETPCFKFRTDDGTEYEWVSEMIERSGWWFKLAVGDRVQLDAFIAPLVCNQRGEPMTRHLRRVKVEQL